MSKGLLGRSFFFSGKPLFSLLPVIFHFSSRAGVFCGGEFVLKIFEFGIHLLLKGLVGGAVTPFILSRIASASGGETVAANVALVANNADVAAAIAVALAETP